jgi:uncharacterized protein YigA (DUF484 family)
MNIIKKLFKKEMTEEEKLFMDVHNLVQRLLGKENHNHKPETIRELFNLHNAATGVMEYSVSCASCRARTWTRLKDWYNNNKDKYKHLL